MRRLVLHMDINGTILMTDAAGGKNLDGMISRVISDCAWGAVTGGSFRLLPLPLSTVPPPEVTHEEGESIMTYSSYLDDVKYPHEVTLSVSDQSVKDAHKAEFKKKRDLRRDAKKVFTEAPNLGHCHHGTHLSLTSKLSLPPLPPSSLSLFPHGHLNILPSFFNTIIKLEEEKRDFKIIFRTFGSDIPDVAHEFNLFCEGEHPLYPGVSLNGSKEGSRDLRIQSKEQFGKFLRTGSDRMGTTLVMSDGEHLHEGFDGIQRSIQSSLEKFNTIGIQDWYQWWADHGERSDAGKPLLVNRNKLSTTSSNGSAHKRELEEHHIFFDDNIQRKEAYIVDVRDACTGEVIPFEEAKDVWLVRAEPLESIVDLDYFLKKINMCEKNLDEMMAKSR